MSRVFVSHSSRDNRQAIAVMRWLEVAEPGLVGEIFLDLDQDTGIRTGQRWTQALWQANARCEAVVCLLSASWVASPECRAEFRQAEGMGKPILCARIEPFDEAEVTRAWQRCDLFGDGPTTEVAIGDGEAPVRLLDEGLQRLLTGLRAVGVGADSFAWPPPEDPKRSPYRGWQPLESVDAAVYFGRDAQIVRALDELDEMRRDGRERMFVILGASGVGKSSFLRAGLLPRLQRDDRRFLTMPILRPERRALTGDSGLARSIHRLRADVGLAQPSLGAIKNAITDPQRVRAWLTEAVGAARGQLMDASESSPLPTLVLPVDQAEELFGSDAGVEAQQFLTVLAALLTESDLLPLNMLVVATIRSDRYEPLQMAPQLSAVQSHLFDRLKPMPSAQFTEVICGPARRSAESGSSVVLSAELVERLAEDASLGADTLPLLALTLSRLYEDYAGTGDTVTVDNYEAMGGIRRVVQTEIDTLLSADPSLRSEELRRLRAAFIPWLATVDADTEKPMRRIARWADLPEDSHDLVNAFVTRRLLVKGERDGQVVVEVALESLLQQWDELADWLRIEAVNLRATDALERAVISWERSGRHDDWLLDGERLTEAETLCAHAGFGARLNPAGEFVLASRRRSNQKLENEKRDAQAHATSLRRRSQILSLLLVLIVAVAAGAIVLGNRARTAENAARHQATQTVAAKLIGQSRAMLGGTQAGGDRRAVQQMVAAEALAPGSDPDALLNTVVDERRLLKIIGTPSDISDAAVSPDGREIAAAGADHKIRRWDLASGKAIGELLTGHTDNEPPTGHTDNMDAVGYSPDGRWIISWRFGDHTARIWDAHSDQEHNILIFHDTALSTSDFNHDGLLLATGSKDGTIRLWNTATGAQVGEPIRGHDGWVTSIAFNPDGSLLASTGVDGAVRLWNVATHQPALPLLPGHDGPVESLRFSPDGHRLASLSQFLNGRSDGPTPGWQLRITDVDTGRPVVDGLTQFDYAPSMLAFSPDGRHIAVGGDNGDVHILDADTGAAIGAPLLSHGAPVMDVAYSADGTKIISADGTSIYVWAADPDRSVGMPLPGFDDEYPYIAVSPDGKTVATRDPDNHSDITLRRVDTGARLRTITTGHVGPITALAWRPDGQAIASADAADYTVRVHDPRSGALVGPPLSGPTDVVSSLSVSSDGHHISAGSLDGSAWLWDITQAPAGGRRLTGNAGPVDTVAFSGDGHRVLAVSRAGSSSGNLDLLEGVVNPLTIPEEMTASSVQVWNSDTGQPDGPAVTGRGGHIAEIAFQNGDHPFISAAAISPNGQRIVVASPGELRVYEVASGKQVGEPWAIGESNSAVAYTNDGRYVVIAASSTIRVLDARTGRPIGTPLRGHTAMVASLSVGADDRTIASGGNDGWMIWPGPSAWRDALCAKLADNMTPDEWNQWVSPSNPKGQTCPGGTT